MSTKYCNDLRRLTVVIGGVVCEENHYNSVWLNSLHESLGSVT